MDPAACDQGTEGNTAKEFLGHSPRCMSHTNGVPKRVTAISSDYINK
jgi:hypothetical protein